LNLRPRLRSTKLNLYHEGQVDWEEFFVEASNDAIKYWARAIGPKIEEHALNLTCDFERQHKVTWK
jgi:hypothetical protein